MFKNYTKVGIRNIIKHKGYSLLNISGLAMGIASSLLILMWVRHELSYDKFHQNSGDLYRVNVEITDLGRIWPTTSIPMSPALKQDFPEIINSTRFRDFGSVVDQGTQRFNCIGAFADHSFINIFNFSKLVE